jgi:hypothetical protein
VVGRRPHLPTKRLAHREVRQPQDVSLRMRAEQAMTRGKGNGAYRAGVGIRRCPGVHLNKPCHSRFHYSAYMKLIQSDAGSDIILAVNWPQIALLLSEV